MKKVILILMTMLIFSCAKEDDNIKVNEYEACDLTVQVDNSKVDATTGLIEFDIIPDKNYSSKSTNKGAVLTSKERIWEKGVIPFYFQESREHSSGGTILGWDDEEDKDSIRAVIDILEMQTGLIIPEYESRAALLEDYNDGVVIGVGFMSNSAHKGKQGGIQPLKITLSKEPRSIKHEWLHTVGFGHEFQRSDRNEHLIVKFDNMHEYWHRQFEIDPLTVDCGKFDINSIMMYGSFQITNDEDLPIMTTIEGETFEANKDLSEGDIKTLKTLYKAEFEKR